MRDGAALLPPMRVARTQSSDGMIPRHCSNSSASFPRRYISSTKSELANLMLLAQSLQPLALLVIEVGQPIAGLALVAAIEGDDLLGGELGVPAQRLEDAEDVVVGDRGALAARRRLRARPILSEGRCLHGGIGSAERGRCKRAPCRALRRPATQCDSMFTRSHFITCRGRPGSVAVCRGSSFCHRSASVSVASRPPDIEVVV